MQTIDYIVLLAGSGLIVFILWFFFGKKKETQKAVSSSGEQNVSVIVEGAYEPSKISVKKDVPVTITFDRKDKGECTDWVIFNKLPTKEDKEIKSRLPEGEKTKVHFTPTQAGEYDFSCAMGMVHGTLVVEE